MSKTFRPYDPDQLLVLPPSVREWLPPDHLVYFVSDVIDTLDLSRIYDSYDEERGFPPYHPLLMTKIILYGQVVGVRSSRKIQRACLEDVGFRVLCAGASPDFRTISDFRKRHLKALADLFTQVLQLCKTAGLVKLGHVAIDGTKVKGNASKHKAMSYSRMVEEEKRLRREVERLFAQAAAEDAEEDRRFGKDSAGEDLPEELRRRESRLKKIQEAKAALEAKAREEAEAAGAQKPEEAKPEAKAQRNFTDPESRIMLGSEKAFVQGYNAQLAVDAEHQIIVAEDVVQQSNDKNLLVRMVEAVCDRVGEAPGAVSADAGYWTEADVERLEWYEIDAYVAPEKVRHREWREAPRTEGPPPEGASTKERMRHKLRTAEGRAQYDRRKVTVEPVCGQMKDVIGLRQFLLRGHENVRGEWRLGCTAHNLLKLYRACRAGVTSVKEVLAAAKTGVEAVPATA
ncbi:MAG TPA: IS1182 family transposase [Spirochaetia bacterium]|nr:IS1182 family transposase [Spirochaetia bacterium]